MSTMKALIYGLMISLQSPWWITISDEMKAVIFEKTIIVEVPVFGWNLLKHLFHVFVNGLKTQLTKYITVQAFWKPHPMDRDSLDQSILCKFARRSYGTVFSFFRILSKRTPSISRSYLAIHHKIMWCTGQGIFWYEEGTHPEKFYGYHRFDTSWQAICKVLRRLPIYQWQSHLGYWYQPWIYALVVLANTWIRLRYKNVFSTLLSIAFKTGRDNPTRGERGVVWATPRQNRRKYHIPRGYLVVFSVNKITTRKYHENMYLCLIQARNSLKIQWYANLKYMLNGMQKPQNS